jgi:hypothetical protein
MKIGPGFVPLRIMLFFLHAGRDSLGSYNA